jgi:hypothetical protein
LLVVVVADLGGVVQQALDLVVVVVVLVLTL